jgi:hypothetical protein
VQVQSATPCSKNQNHIKSKQNKNKSQPPSCFSLKTPPPTALQHANAYGFSLWPTSVPRKRMGSGKVVSVAMVGEEGSVAARKKDSKMNSSAILHAAQAPR